MFVKCHCLPFFLSRFPLPCLMKNHLRHFDFSVLHIVSTPFDIRSKRILKTVSINRFIAHCTKTIQPLPNTTYPMRILELHHIGQRQQLAFSISQYHFLEAEVEVLEEHGLVPGELDN